MQSHVMPRTLTTFPMNQFGASRISRQWPGSTVISGKNIKAKQHHGIASAARVGWASILLYWHPHDMLNTSIIHRKNGILVK